jgi:uncharacterized protein YdiU (UPF0061 family)
MDSARPAPIAFDNSFASAMEGFYVPWKGARAPAPAMVKFNHDLAAELGLDSTALAGETGAAIFSGTEAPTGASPLAMVYAGHQFGQFSPQLGDGRALLIGEVIDRNGQRRDIHLKGSGPTPFSRRGDGKAVLGPVLREYLIGEAMHALGIPTTRALAAVTTGESIEREGYEPGAVLARVAASHLRVGTFQFFAARGEVEKVRQLADYAIARHDPDLAGDPARYLAFFGHVVERQARLIARWMLAGFVHGVMNTDNMTISGETIDYGPCAFIDDYDPEAVFSSIDRGGRYAYGNQPGIAQWNLARLGETLLPLINAADPEKAVAEATEVLGRFPAHYQHAWLAGMRLKLGLTGEGAGDLDLAVDLEKLMAAHQPDYTALFRGLADLADGKAEQDIPAIFTTDEGKAWLARWRERLGRENRPPAEHRAAMNGVNPLYIPRNYLVEAALRDAGNGDLTAFDRLLEALQQPYTERAGFENIAAPPPPGTPKCRTFCGT